MSNRLLKFSQVSEKVGLSRRTIYTRIKNGTFPKQRKIGYASRWLEIEIETWMESL
ncbi:helix-turn-helix transcriptional regulator [Pseudomonas sp. GM79]|uniref:helix-turn-helix transcriptional regulator n=1 Tax=Pseudomonas sp. GM79 TaxID=1144338 RepID=UPI0009D9B0EB|nr:AlpA family phage regulatory protein [Pseudomonas sp. GM79]